MRARPYTPTYRIRETPAPQPLPGADLIEKAENVAVREVLMRAIEQVEQISITEPDRFDRWRSNPRPSEGVKEDALAVLRRLRDEA